MFAIDNLAGRNLPFASSHNFWHSAVQACFDMGKSKKPKPVKPSKRAKGADKVSVPAAAQKGKQENGFSTRSDTLMASEDSVSATGVIGLSNLGNTCFFNSVLQVTKLRLSAVFCAVSCWARWAIVLLLRHMCGRLQVLVASPPLQQFFSQPSYKMQQAPLSGGLCEVFQQAQSSKFCNSGRHCL